jgi:hypothetical protein
MTRATKRGETTAMTPELAAPVRSIRVASALADRFGSLIRVRDYRDAEQFENVLGEARQIYPAIWSNLDDARMALAARDIDLTAYDSLRAMPVAHLGGVLDVDVDADAKAASFNSAGHAAAREACHVLRAALPSVDWAQLERDEAAQLAAFGSLGPPLWKKVVFFAFMAVLAGLALVGFLFYKLG